MIRKYSRALNVIAAVESARELHREFRRPVNGPAIRAVLMREAIPVIYRAVRKSFVLGMGETFVITLSTRTPASQRWKRALHEYAHIRLHFPEQEELVRNLVPCSAGDPREHEANLFALLLVLGPTATPDHPAVAALVAKLEAPAYRARMPEQLPLEIPERMPSYKDLPQPFQHEREYERGVVHRGAKNLRPKGSRIFRDPPKPADFDRIKWFDETKGTTRFEDVAGRYWWIYNFRKTPSGWERISDFMRPDITHRLFVNAAGTRRLYQFADQREHRAYRVKHLDRQITQATKLPARTIAVSHDGRALPPRTHR